MLLTLGQAAHQVGRSKSALSRDVKAGRLSASRNDDGSFAIDPAELARVFPPAQGNGAQAVPWRATQQPPATAATAEPTVAAALRERIADKDALIGELRADKEGFRRRLDESERARREERQAAIEERRRLLALLTDQRQPAAAPRVEPVGSRPTAIPARSWWRRRRHP